MQRLTLLVLVFFTWYSASAQDSSATVLINPGEYAAAPSSQQLHNYLRESQVWIGPEMRDDFNAIELAIGYDKGNWIDAQGADKVRTLTARTEGKTSFNKFSIWGEFKYHRALEDSTSLRHQTRINADAPVYFGAHRRNYYERDVYSLAAVGQYGLQDYRWPITLGMDYRVGNHFSNNDPRGKINDFQLNSYLSIGHQADTWSVHMGGIAGYGRERISVDYKNDKYKENTADPLYINWYMNGFGRATRRLNNQNYNDDFLRYGARLHASLRTPWGNLKGTLEALREEQKFKIYDTSPQTYSLLNHYTKDRYDLDLLWSTISEGDVQSNLRIQAGMIDGFDFNYELMRNNYTYRQEYARFHFLLKRHKTEWHLGAEFASTSQHDGSMAIWQKNQFIEPVAGLRYGFALADRQTIHPQIQGGYRHPFSAQLTFPEGLAGDFSETIILYNAAYLSTPSAFVNISADYQFRRDAKTAIGVKLDTQYRWRTASPVQQQHPTHWPGTDRWHSALTLGYYF